MRPTFLTLTVLAAVLTPVNASGLPAATRAYRVVRTFVPGKGMPNPFRRSDVLAVDFLTTGFARPDGSDICVFAGKDGRPVDFKVMMIGPGDRARVAIRMVPEETEYYVCYGGPAAPPGKWEPDVGLILETRKFNGGNPGNLPAMQGIVEASGPSYGRWFVPHVFHGFNLFGPSDNYVSVYHGWLHVAKAGEYRFATTSKDASFFLVDGKLVSSKPGWGPGPANARLAGPPADLAEGVHEINYHHVGGQGGQWCVAAWQPPGGEFQLIPPAAFPGVFVGKQTALQITGLDAPVDLTCELSGGVIHEKQRLYCAFFKNTTAGKPRRYRPLWSFGDGTTSEERDPEHVYFSPGEYTVTLTVSGPSGVSKISQRIVVAEEWEPPRQWPTDTAPHYYEIVKKYDFAGLSSRDLASALEFFASLGKDEEIMKTAETLVARDDTAARKNMYRAAVLLGERLRDLKGRPEEALAVFRKALDQESDDANKARLMRRIGDTLLYLEQPDEALAQYNLILDRFARLDDKVVRLAQICVGNAWRAKGDYERSVAAYQKAAAMPIGDERPAGNTRRGFFAHSIEDYIARKEFDRARDALDTWCWEQPAALIEGQWSLLAAGLALAKGDRPAAVREATNTAAANPRGPYADQLLLLAGTACLESGQAAQAVKIAFRVRDEYPESGHLRDAALIECRGLLLDKKYEDAAKKAVEAYAQYAGQDGAARFLLVAADAALGLGDKDDAAQLLRTIIKSHPDAGEAAAAREKLKTLGSSP